MFHIGRGGQERTGKDTFLEMENKEILTVVQPTDNLATFHGGQDKTDPEQLTDNLEIVHGGQDKTETKMFSDTENKLTVIPLDKTSTDQLMNRDRLSETKNNEILT
ncbi:Hypothetical predicted protein, partial [Mytilus galloprovincialis]